MKQEAPCLALEAPHKTGLRAVLVLVLLPLIAALHSPANAVTLCDSLNAGRYDIIYVCPAAWRTEVVRLAIHRAQPLYGGYSSIIAPLENIATCFGSGRIGIRAMIHHAIQSWSAPPKHVVLIGAYDAFDTTTYIIPSWFIADRTIGFWYEAKFLVATEDPYVYMPGASDRIPAVSLGRIPAWDVGAVHDYIDKVINYESQDLATWKHNALHVVDDRDLDGNSGYLARQRADSLADHQIAGRESYYSRSFVYASSAPPIANLPVIQSWNSGVGFVLGYGTAGSWKRLAQFDQSGLCRSPQAGNDSLLTNYRTPVVLSMTCGGSYVKQSDDHTYSAMTCGSLPMYLLGAVNKGAVSVTGPTRAIRETAAYAIAREWFLTSFAVGPAVYAEPGKSLQTVKANLQARLPDFKNEILSMVCLGDPSLRMPIGDPPVVGFESDGPRTLVLRPAQSPSREVAFVADLPRAGAYIFRLFDVQGRQVATKTLAALAPQSGAVIHFREDLFRPGIYFVAAQSGSFVATAKLVLLK